MNCPRCGSSMVLLGLGLLPPPPPDHVRCAACRLSYNPDEDLDNATINKLLAQISERDRGDVSRDCDLRGFFDRCVKHGYFVDSDDTVCTSSWSWGFSEDRLRDFTALVDRTRNIGWRSEFEKMRLEADRLSTEVLKLRAEIEHLKSTTSSERERYLETKLHETRTRLDNVHAALHGAIR